MTDRLLVLFARAPGSEARAKGLPEEPASGFFLAVAREWREAARRAGARFAVSAPPRDLPAWRRSLRQAADVVWIEQRGASFGRRLEDTARRAGRLARTVVITGGDVVPSAGALASTFHALASGADAVISPAPDGGVSLLALSDDSDLLRTVGRRRRDVFRYLHRRLKSRERRVDVVDPVADVDGPEALGHVPGSPRIRRLASLVRRACRPPAPRDVPDRALSPAPARSTAALRGPPLAA